MAKLVFCMDCGECLGEDREYVAKEHLKKFSNHVSFLTKTIIDPFLLDDIDDWIKRKMRSTDYLHEKNQPQNGQSTN